MLERILGKTIRECERFSPESLLLGKQDKKGRFFFTSDARFHDLSHIRLLHWGVDTVRQLYKGCLNQDVINQLAGTMANGEDRFILGNTLFHLGKMGKASGYRFKLQNNDAGLIVLVGSYYTKAELEGVHLKIEVSPQLLASLDADELTARLASVAEAIMQPGYKPSGVAVHIACDFQGWEPSRDFLDSFSTRARRMNQYFGISKGEFNLSEAATLYGRPESFTVGKADSLQTCLYRKDLEANKSDKIDFWKAMWGEKYDPEQNVWRLEVRMHHTVTGEAGRGFGEDFTTLQEAQPYLPDLWAYCLNTNRLDIYTKHIHPVWQLIRDDAPRQEAKMRVKRVKKESLGGIARNIANTIGNMVSIYARQRMPFLQLWKTLKGLEIWQPILHYYHSRGLTEPDVRIALQRAYQMRYLLGSVA